MEHEKSRRTSRIKTAAIAIAAIGGTIAFFMVFFSYAAPVMGDTPLSGHGLIALILGATFTILLAVVLMGLVFFSSRRGYDEKLSQAEDANDREG